MTNWSQILELHGRIVWKTVNRFIEDDTDAADCFQETFVAAFEFSRKHPIHNWPGLLKRLATTNALIRLRKRTRQTTLPASACNSPEIADKASQPREVAESHELFERLREALASLPADQAQACCLRFLEGLSYVEIAEGLGVTVNHVGVLLNRAKASLRDYLQPFAPPSSKRLRD